MNEGRGEMGAGREYGVMQTISIDVDNPTVGMIESMAAQASRAFGTTPHRLSSVQSIPVFIDEEGRQIQCNPGEENAYVYRSLWESNPILPPSDTP
jgi:hypothetical protein